MTKAKDDAEALSRLESTIDDVAAAVDGRVESFTDEKTGVTTMSVETDDQAIVGSGHSELEAASHLLKELKAGGWA